MTFEFRLPDIGEGVVEGEIVQWLVKVGDTITEDQPLIEVMTDKATVVIPSPKAGTVLETRGGEGDIAQVHEILALIELAGEASATPAAPAAETSPAPSKPAPSAPNTTVIPEPVPSEPPAVGVPAAEVVTVVPVATGRKVLAAPATRRLARELHVDISAIDGTGPSGRVTSEDVKRANQPEATVTASQIAAAADRVTMVPIGAPAVPAAPEQTSERIAIRGMRKKIWENMARSKTLAAHFTFVEECDCDRLVDLRRRFNANLSEGEPKLTYLPFIIKAVIASLKKFPGLNGHVDEADMAFVQRSDFHIGVAAATERGLIVPVIRNADRYSLLGLARELKRLGDAARSGRISMDDLGGSTFTVTSLGKEGGIFATPVINHPEVAIMGVHKMVKRPMVDDDDEIVVRTMMNMSLSFDHRLVDGHIGAGFTYSVIKLLQSPDRLMMEMA